MLLLCILVQGCFHFPHLCSLPEEPESAQQCIYLYSCLPDPAPLGTPLGRLVSSSRSVCSQDGRTDSTLGERLLPNACSEPQQAASSSAVSAWELLRAPPGTSAGPWAGPPLPQLGSARLEASLGAKRSICWHGQGIASAAGATKREGSGAEAPI